MKKINVYFILECTIILLLLAILWILLRDNGTSREEQIPVIGNESAWEEIKSTQTDLQPSGDADGADFPGQKEEGMVSEDVEVEASEDKIETVSVNDIGVESRFLEGKNILVFGDSIWDSARGEDGISEHIQEKTGATVYNCAVGGSCAALVNEENNMERWNSSSFNGMIYVARDLVSAERVLSGYHAYEVMQQVDLEEMDYLLVSYGINDLFSNVSIYPEFYYDIYSYVGALRNGINKLKENYPQLQIVLLSPTYTELYQEEKDFKIKDYVEASRGVAAEMEIPFVDMFAGLGNDAASRLSLLEDGVHLSSDGRKVYADVVIHFLKNM